METVPHSRLPELIERVEHWERRVALLKQPIREKEALQRLAGQHSRARELTHTTLKRLAVEVETAERSAEAERQNLRVELAESLGYSEPEDVADYGEFRELKGKNLYRLLDAALQLRDFRENR